MCRYVLAVIPALSGQDPEHRSVEAIPDLRQGDQSRSQHTQVNITCEFVSQIQINLNVAPHTHTHREKLAQAYDFALEKIGMDLHAFSIWTDYISFLKSVDATGSYAENQKITAVRKVYQKAVVTPIIGIEMLWKEYIMFEQNINPIISEKMSLERSRDYMNARRVAKELEISTKGLNRNLPAVPPTLTKDECRQVGIRLSFESRMFDSNDFFNDSQLELWKRYITFEKSNPLRSEDTALVTRRVMFATEQCLLVLTHHPAVWHQAAQYLDQSAKLLTEKGVRSFPSIHPPPTIQCDVVLAFANKIHPQLVVVVIQVVVEAVRSCCCCFCVICPVGLS